MNLQLVTKLEDTLRSSLIHELLLILSSLDASDHQHVVNYAGRLRDGAFKYHVLDQRKDEIGIKLRTKTIKEVAGEYGYSLTGFKYWMVSRGIRTRDMRGSQRLKKAKRHAHG